jgi:hypothetical protein
MILPRVETKSAQSVLGSHAEWTCGGAVGGASAVPLSLHLSGKSLNIFIFLKTHNFILPVIASTGLLAW